MNKQLKEAYSEIVSIINDNSKFFISDKKNLNEREKILSKIGPIFVIGDNVDAFMNEVRAQEISGIVNIFSAFRADQAIKLIDTNKANLLKNYFSKISGIATLGCHISHALVCKYMVENNINNAIICENDCAFYEYFSNDFLNKIVDYYLDNEKINILNLGAPARGRPQDINGNNYPEKNIYENEHFKIFKTQTPLTHFYIVNNKISKLMLKSIKIDSDINKIKYNNNFLYKPGSFGENNCIEGYFRAGGDDFYMTWTDMYNISPAMSYQNYVSDNQKSGMIKTRL